MKQKIIFRTNEIYKATEKIKKWSYIWSLQELWEAHPDGIAFRSSKEESLTSIVPIILNEAFHFFTDRRKKILLCWNLCLCKVGLIWLTNQNTTIFAEHSDCKYVFSIGTFIVVWLVFHAGGLKDVPLNLLNRMIGG